MRFIMKMNNEEVNRGFKQRYSIWVHHVKVSQVLPLLSDAKKQSFGEEEREVLLNSEANKLLGKFMKHSHGANFALVNES